MCVTAASKSKTKKTSKKNRVRGIQAYFTKFAISYALSSLIKMRAPGVKTVLDPSGGLGHLLEGFRKYQSITSPDPVLTMVEPCQPYEDDQPFKRLRKDIGFYNMTFEEWCITYADNDQYDLVFANPPFGERIGTSQLGEDLTQMFLPDVTRFESMFFLASSKVAKSYMAFIVPDSYFNHSEALPVMNYLASVGWNLTEIRSLPLDACYSAKENMSFLLFDRSSVYEWPKPALELIKNQQTQPLLEDVEIKTVAAHHGTKTGYLLPHEATPEGLANMIDTQRTFFPDSFFQSNGADCFPFHWEPSPQPQGAVWNRQGVYYQLGEFGWVLANDSGYTDGVPVNEDFKIAQKAFELYQKGAVYSAYAKTAGIDLDALKREYRDISSASFLALLGKGSVDPQPLVRDLENLGMLKIDDPVPVHSDVERVGAFLVHRKTVSDAQACKLFIENKILPDWLREKAMGAIENQYIPVDKITLRAPWIPRTLIAAYLGWKLDDEGLYVGYNNDVLERYLNYGKDGRITETDQEEFQVESERFSVLMNDHQNPDFSALRKRVHAHYLINITPKRLVQEAFNRVPSAKPLHAWQTDDIDFYLSGATISNLDVGLGKTLTALKAAVVHCSGGAKALITVPKQVLSKWLATLKQFFPTVRGEILGFVENSKGTMVRLPKDQLTEQAQKLFFDPAIPIIFTSHQVFGEFRVNPEDRMKADLTNAFDQLGSGLNLTQIKQRAVFVKQAGQRTYRNGGDITFSDLPKGLLVVVDEAHNFKGLFGMPYSGWGESLIMAGQCGESKRAYDMQVKLDLVRARGGKTLALTATVINNSVAEIYNMLRIFAPQVLKAKRIRNTQQLIDYFCYIDSVTSVSLTGQVKSGQTIKGFLNVQELQTIWESCMITKTAEDVGLPLPEAHEIVERIAPTPEITRFMNKWKEMLELEIKKSELETAKSNDENGHETEKVGMLRIISMLDKVASFPPQCGIKDNPKFDKVTENVMGHYNQHGGQQIIFADEKEVQSALADRLVDQGIPRKQIAIINAETAPNIKQRLKVAEDFNAGVYRIAIGGKIISEGIDLQQNTIAAHFLNLAWEGGTIHQRKGRLVRQGNQNDEVFIYYYLLAGSTDDYRYLTIANKTHWGESLRKTQCETLQQGVFSDPVSDDFLCALAINPTKMKNILIKKRNARELVKQLIKAERIFKKLLDFANPQNRAQSMEILQKYEAKLRKLDCIPEAIVNEGIYRVQVLAQLHSRLISGFSRFRDWEDLVKNDKALIKIHGYVKPGHNAFTLRKLENEIAFEFVTLEDYLGWQFRGKIPDFAPTFGKENPIKDQPSLMQTAQGPALDIVVIDPAKRQEQAPVIPLQPAKDQAPNEIVTTPAPTAKAAQNQEETKVTTFKAKTVEPKPSEVIQTKPWPKTVVQLGLFYSVKPKQKAKTRKAPTQKPSPKVAVQLSLFDLFEAPSSKAS